MAKMSEDILVNIQFEGINLGTNTQLQVTPSNIAWEDLELMLKVYADEEKLIIKYMDEEGDEITIGSQEELEMAFKVAKSTNNTLSVRAICEGSSAGLKDQNAAAEPAAEPEIASSAMAPDDDQPDDVVRDADAMGEVEEADLGVRDDVKGAAAAEEDLVADKDKTKKKENKRKPKPTPRKCHLFFIESASDGLVLEVKDGNPSAGVRVILSPTKSTSDPNVNNQLWYLDKETKTIRSVLNDFCLDAQACEDGSRVCRMMPYKNTDSYRQHWVWSSGHLVNASNKALSLVAANSSKHGSYLQAQICHQHGLGRMWNLIPVEDSKHGFGQDPEDGGDKSSRPKPYKRSKRDHFPQLSVSPQTASVCQDVRTRSVKHRSTSTLTSDFDERSPSWFCQYMERFKKELHDDLGKHVARRTVHQMLKALNITDNDRHSPPAPLHFGSADGASGSSETTAVYRHTGVICDYCDMAIVGIRYKCGNCEDFDLCENCESLDGSHDPDHVFLKIRRPIPVIVRKKNGRTVPLLRTNLYVVKDDKYTIDDHFAKKGDKLKRRKEKLLKKYEEFEEKIRRKEEKLKRHLDAVKELPKKKEKLEVPSLDISVIDLEFVRHVNIPDGSHVQPGTRIVKKWLVKNTGAMTWNKEHVLTVVDGTLFPIDTVVAVPALEPDQEGVISVVLVAPDDPGDHFSYWCLCYKNNQYGSHISCNVVVDPRETLEPISAKDTVLHVAEDNTQGLENNQTDEVTQLESMAESSKSSESTASESDTDKSNEMKNLMSSYETLTLADQADAKPSQTATPTNTPRDITPPKSPIPEIRTLSNSSSVEVVPAGGDDTVSDTTVTNITDLVQEKMASLGFKQIDPDDLDMWSSCEEFQTDDSDSDFFVVPIPDCFNPDLPPTTLASTSVIVKKTECRTIDELLTTSYNFEMPPLLMPTKSSDNGSSSEVKSSADKGNPDKKLDDASGKSESTSDDNNDEPAGTDKGREPQAASSEEADEGQAVSDQEGCITRQDGQTCTSNDEKIENNCKQTAEVKQSENEATIPKVLDVPDEGATGGVDLLIPEEDDQATDQNANLPLDINENSAGTPNQEEEASADAKTNNPPPTTYIDDPRALTPGPAELATQWVSAAQGVASIATMAAHSAFNTARDVFRTLQYTPPKSNWTPPQDTWTPKQTQASGTHLNQPPSLLDQLVEMGFANRELNQRLLEKYNNDLDKVIQELVQEADNDWPVSRH